MINYTCLGMLAPVVGELKYLGSCNDNLVGLACFLKVDMQMTKVDSVCKI